MTLFETLQIAAELADEEVAAAKAHCVTISRAWDAAEEAENDCFSAEPTEEQQREMDYWFGIVEQGFARMTEANARYDGAVKVATHTWAAFKAVM